MVNGHCGTFWDISIDICPKCPTWRDIWDILRDILRDIWDIWDKKGGGGTFAFCEMSHFWGQIVQKVTSSEVTLP